MNEKINQFQEKIKKEKLRQVIGDLPKSGLFNDEISLDDLNFKPISEGLGITSRDRNELKFVKKSELPKAYVHKELPQYSNTSQRSPYFLRALAYIIDLNIVLFINVVIFSVIALILKINIDQVKQALMTTNFQIIFGALYLFIYVIYFTLMDVVASWGKSIFGLHVEITPPIEKLSLKRSFCRTILSIPSLLFGIVPLAMGLHDKICSTGLFKDAR